MTIEAFKKEVLPLKNRLYRLALRLLIDHMEAEDVVQEVFMKLWSKRNQLQQYRSIEAFAMVITKNKCFDILKSKRYKIMDGLSADLSVNHMSPYSYAENADSIDHVLALINKLPELQKIIIHLRDVEGYDFDEIAGITELSLNAVRVNLSRARKNVREGLIKVNKYELYEN